MLLNLHKKTWSDGLKLANFQDHTEENAKSVKVSILNNFIILINLQFIQSMLSLAEAYNKSVLEEMSMTQDQLKTRHVGKQDPKKHLEDNVEKLMVRNIVQATGMMIDAVTF